MKKLTAFLLVIVMLLPMVSAAYATEIEEAVIDEPAADGSVISDESAQASGTITLTTSVPAASYTLNIPADVNVAYNATATSLGNVTVSNSAGFSSGKDLQVTVNYSAFTSGTASTTIPYSLYVYHKADGYYAVEGNLLASGSALLFKGQGTGAVDAKATCSIVDLVSGSPDTRSVENITIGISSADWAKAQSGSYSSTITFSAKVVNG